MSKGEQFGYSARWNAHRRIRSVPILHFLVDRARHIVAELVGVALGVVNVSIAADAQPVLFSAVPPKAATVALLPVALLDGIPMKPWIQYRGWPQGHERVVELVGIGPQECGLVRKLLAIDAVREEGDSHAQPAAAHIGLQDGHQRVVGQCRLRVLQCEHDVRIASPEEIHDGDHVMDEQIGIVRLDGVAHEVGCRVAVVDALVHPGEGVAFHAEMGPMNASVRICGILRVRTQEAIYIGVLERKVEKFHGEQLIFVQMVATCGADAVAVLAITGGLAGGLLAPDILPLIVKAKDTVCKEKKARPRGETQCNRVRNVATLRRQGGGVAVRQGGVW